MPMPREKSGGEGLQLSHSHRQNARMEINRLDFLKLALASLSASSIGILPMILNPHRREAGATPEPWTRGPEWLEKWKQASRVPIREGGDVTTQRLLAAMESGRPVSFRYWSGSNPGELRRVSPGWLFESDGFPNAYLSGFCHQRQAERVFQLGSMEFTA